MSCQHLESFTERDMMLMLMISSSSLQDPLGSFYMLANRLVHLGSFFVGLQLPVNHNLLYLVPFTYFR